MTTSIKGDKTILMNTRYFMLHLNKTKNLNNCPHIFMLNECFFLFKVGWVSFIVPTMKKQIPKSNYISLEM